MYHLIPKKYHSVIKKLRMCYAQNVKFIKQMENRHTGETLIACVENKESWSYEENILFFKIPESVSCIVDDKWIIIYKKHFPKICSALLLFSKSLKTISKEEKYLQVYKAYELMTKNRKIEFRSIRHAIGHSPAFLDDKKVIETLNKLFGTVDVDLSKKKHTDIFYEYYIKLLIEVDEILYKELNKIIPKKSNYLGFFYLVLK